MIVPYDCVHGRSEISHAVNLFDMSEKYADVMSVADTLQVLKQLKPAAPLRAAR